MGEPEFLSSDITQLGDEYFSISDSAHGGWCTLRMEGERLDMQLSAHLKSMFVLLSSCGVHRIVFDMERCDYCDSSGLGAIVAGHKLCRMEGGKLVLYGVNPNLTHLMKLSQLDAILPMAYTAEQLEQHFARHTLDLA